MINPFAITEANEETIKSIMTVLMLTDFSKAYQALHKPSLQGWFVGKVCQTLSFNDLNPTMTYDEIAKIVGTVFVEYEDWIEESYHGNRL